MNNSQSTFFTGSIQMQVRDEVNNISFPVLVHYPSNEASTPTAIGPYTMDVCVNGVLADGKFPLVIISHGNGGSHLLYRTISMHLAKNGYIVAMPEHYGNNRNDNHLENTNENLINRPQHISLTINTMLADERFAEKILHNKIAVIGHSMGGYTALALAGGIPRTREGEVIEVAADKRIGAIVLLAPGTGWFMHSLEKVTVPISMLTAEHDPVTPDWNAEIVLNYVPDRSQVAFRKVPNASHFSFLSPFPAAMKNPNFLPSADPEGFDREQFHKELPQEILEFLNEKLNPDNKSQ